MKTVKYDDFCDEVFRVNQALDVLSGEKRAIQLITMTESPVQVGINWGASLGTVSSECAERFASALHAAVILAENFRYNGYEIEY